MSHVENQFQLVMSEKEREQFINSVIHSRIITSIASDGQEFVFEYNTRKDDNLILNVVLPYARSLKVGEPMDLLFGLQDGFYLLKTSIEQIEFSQVTFPMLGELAKLQRRNNFRAKVIPDFGMTFRLTSHRNQRPARAVDMQPLDISAGGFRLKWPGLQSLPACAQGDAIAGMLTLPGARTLEIFGEIKTVAKHDFGNEVGVEFQNLSLKDEQALLFISMDLHRRQSFATKL